MAFDSRQMALLGPTSVAIHNDSHMLWQVGFGFGA
jgi:hypothetical protein